MLTWTAGSRTPRLQKGMKRGLDILVASLGLFFLLPIVFIILLAILVFDGRPVFFRQQRVGRLGRPFRIWKFRTMDSDPTLSGLRITVEGDPRISNLGRFLRRFKLDELPQLWNVILGEMSLVGPRPEVPAYVELYDEKQRQVLLMRPGITDPASILYRNESAILSEAKDPERLYIDCIMPDKIRMNLEYASRANVLTDIYIILRTIGVSLCGKKS